MEDKFVRTICDEYRAECKKTKRLRGSKIRSVQTHECCNPEISVSRNITHSGTRTLIPVTPIDEHLSLNQSSHSMNSKNIWENVIDELEEQCDKKTQKYNRYDQSYDILYTVPVSGTVVQIHKDYNTEQQRISTAGWFSHEGKYYDPKKLYEIDNYTNLTAINKIFGQKDCFKLYLYATILGIMSTEHD